MTHIDTMKQALEALEATMRTMDDIPSPPFPWHENIAAIAALRLAIEQAERQNIASHDLYTDVDKDRPDVICDSNGQVALSLCKWCGKGEAELYEHRCTGEQAERQEPVAWMVEDADGRHFIFRMQKPVIREDETLTPLYTAPPQRQPLTERDIVDACLSYRRNFGLMEPEERKRLMVQAKEWASSFGLEVHGITGGEA